MATIDPNGVLIYQDTDNYTPIHTALNLAQSNLSSILGANTQIVRVSSVGDRNAKATARGSISKANPFVAWRADAADGLQLEYTTNGTAWNSVITSAVAGVPYAMAAGQGGITVTQGSTATLAVSFPGGRFSTAPRVTFSQNGSNPQLVNMIMGGVTATGFTIYASRNVAGTSVAYFDWQAVQMFSTSASG